MSASIKSLINAGTKLWLDSIDPDLVQQNFAMGATGATSNPIIVADLIKSGRFDAQITELIQKDLGDSEIAWAMTDQLVKDAQSVFLPIWESSKGNDGYVSFEVDPLLEDPTVNIPHDERVRNYVKLAKKWSAGNQNRMIKVPATPAGLDALEEIAAEGIPLNVTLIFTSEQYQRARDAVWRGAEKRGELDKFKSVYSIFVSRIDVYTGKHCDRLSDEAQGLVGIVNAKRIWQENQDFWQDKNCTLEQEIIFASTGTKRPEDPKWKYVEALAGSDIQTNPPATNQVVADNKLEFSKQLDQLPADEVLNNIDTHVNFSHMHDTLMEEGIAKFATPQIGLIELMKQKRETLAKA